MFATTALVNEFDCSRGFLQEIMVSTGAQFVIFLIVDDTVANRYRYVVPPGDRFDAEGVPFLPGAVCVLKLHDPPSRLS